MELASEIQAQLLPKIMPTIPGFEVIGWNRPARQVGGDYYGFQGLGDGRWGLVVGDVTGKGMPAALLVSTLHSALRVLLDRMEVGPALIERLNQHIYESSSSNKFITMLLAALDSEGSRLATGLPAAQAVLRRRPIHRSRADDQFGIEKVRFLRPVPAGSEISLKARVMSARKRSQGILMRGSTARSAARPTAGPRAGRW